MAIITLSRGTYSGAKELAEYIARNLGYQLLSREALVDELKRFGWADEKLNRVRNKNLGIMPRMNLEWVHYLACLRAVLSEKVLDEALVYHGNQGQFVLRDFPHILSIRVIADMEYRIKALMARNEYAIDRKEAVKIINRIDQRRARWSKFLYQTDINDASSFDMVVDLSRKSIADAYEMIHNTVILPQFNPTPESRKTIQNLIRAAQLRAKIAMDTEAVDDDIEVVIRDGVVSIEGTVHSVEDADAIRELLRKEPDIVDVESRVETQVEDHLELAHADYDH